MLNFKMTVRAVFSCLALLLLLSNGRAAAGQPYNKSTFGVYYLHNTNRSLYHRYWDPAHGFEISFITDFYFGKLNAGVSRLSHHSRDNMLAEFDSYFPYVGWQYALKVENRAELYCGPRIGSFMMYFDDDEVSVGTRSELELGIEIAGGTRFFVSNNFGIDLAARHRVLFTREKVRLTFLSAGLCWRFGTPKWLKAVLK